MFILYQWDQAFHCGQWWVEVSTKGYYIRISVKGCLSCRMTFKGRLVHSGLIDWGHDSTLDSASNATVILFRQRTTDCAFEIEWLQEKDRWSLNTQSDQWRDDRCSCNGMCMWQWGLCDYVTVHTILPPSAVILWMELGGKPKWLPLKFGYHDVMRTSPICRAGHRKCISDII